MLNTIANYALKKARAALRTHKATRSRWALWRAMAWDSVRELCRPVAAGENHG